MHPKRLAVSCSKRCTPCYQYLDIFCSTWPLHPLSSRIIRREVVQEGAARPGTAQKNAGTTMQVCNISHSVDSVDANSYMLHLLGATKVLI